MKIKWKCRYCKKNYTSKTEEHHKLDMCSCNKSGIDAEKDYLRILGGTEIIN